MLVLRPEQAGFSQTETVFNPFLLRGKLFYHNHSSQSLVFRTISDDAYGDSSLDPIIDIGSISPTLISAETVVDVEGALEVDGSRNKIAYLTLGGKLKTYDLNTTTKTVIDTGVTGNVSIKLRKSPLDTVISYLKNTTLYFQNITTNFTISNVKLGDVTPNSNIAFIDTNNNLRFKSSGGGTTTVKSYDALINLSRLATTDTTISLFSDTTHEVFEFADGSWSQIK